MTWPCTAHNWDNKECPVCTSSADHEAVCRQRDILKEALLKIYDPKKYHHVEPDAYTQAVCFQFVAQEALKAVGVLDVAGEDSKP